MKSSRPSRTIAVLLLFAICLTVAAGEEPPASTDDAAAAAPPAPDRMDKAINRHYLTDFGPYGTVEEARATLKIAMDKLVADGGGVLVIPMDAPKKFFPENTSQEKYGDPAVTIVDYRGGIERLYVPSAGTHSSDPARGGGCHITERHLYNTLPWQGVYSTEKTLSHYRGGASSYMQYLSRDTKAGENARFYIPTLRGLFVGQVLGCSGQPRGYGQPYEWLTVKEFGLDGTDPYLVADAKYDHPQWAIIYNKNVVNSYTINDISNCDNQSMSFIIDRHTYGIGDSFCLSAQMHYQGGFMSGAGDEGGVVYTAEVVHDLDAFRGTVETWNPETRELVYAAGSRNPQKIGTSRAIVNMNRQKWVTAGTCRIVPPGYGYLRDKAHPGSLVVGSADAGWDESLVGRFFAVNEPTEVYGPDEGPSSSRGGTGYTVYRWWHVTGVEPREDGGSDLYVETMWWGASRRGGPSLFRRENYTRSEKETKALRYIIAPGAWVSDPRKGISGLIGGNYGTATQNEPRTLILAPAPSFGTPVDFAQDDPIRQALDPSVWLPTGYRVRNFNGFPGMMGGASFQATNWGKVQSGVALQVSGRSGKLEDILAGQKDGQPPYAAALHVMTATQNAIVVRGPVTDAAMDLWMYDGNPKPIRWRLNYSQSGRHAASIGADPETGDIVLAGRAVDTRRSGTVNQTGISETAVPAKNLRGINIPVPEGEATLSVAFPGNRQEADAAYSLAVQPNWKTMDWVTAKTAEGFTVEFSDPAPAGARIDWQLIR